MAELNDDSNDRVVTQLECPVCFRCCSKPIYMCLNGHNVCSTCQPSLNTCPVCRVAGRPTNRNLFAEEFIINGLVPCKNVEQGCKKVLKLKEMSDHLKVCDFGLKCMFEDCKWRGPANALSAHAQSTHSEYVIQIGDDGVLFSVEFDQVCMKCGENCNRPIHRTAMFKVGQRYYWFMSEQTVDRKFKVQIRHIEKDYSRFYQLKFVSTDEIGSFTLLYKNKVRSLTDPAFSDSVFEGDLKMGRYLQGNVLTFEFKIIKDKSFLESLESSLLDERAKFNWFNPQCRQRALPNWEDLQFFDLGDGINDRILSKEEFSKYFQSIADQNNVDSLEKDYQSYLLHSS